MDFYSKQKNLNIININGYVIDQESGLLISVPKHLKVYNIPQEVKMLPETMFIEFRDAEEVYFADNSILKLPYRFFSVGGSRIRKVHLPKGIKSLESYSIDGIHIAYNFPSTLEYLGASMYPTISHLVIPSNIKALGSRFAYCDKNLISIEVPGSIKTLPVHFVGNCKNLKKLILHEGVEKALNGAFLGLSSIEYVSLPESFCSPFQISNTFYTGNSVYSSRNLNGKVLTIRKKYNGVFHTFKMDREMFKKISFKDNVAIIETTFWQGKKIHISLCVKENMETIYELDFQTKQVQKQFIPISESLPKEKTIPPFVPSTKIPIEENKKRFFPIDFSQKMTAQEEIPKEELLKDDSILTSLEKNVSLENESLATSSTIEEPFMIDASKVVVPDIPVPTILSSSVENNLVPIQDTLFTLRDMRQQYTESQEKSKIK